MRYCFYERHVFKNIILVSFVVGGIVFGSGCGGKDRKVAVKQGNSTSTLKKKRQFSASEEMASQTDIKVNQKGVANFNCWWRRNVTPKNVSVMEQKMNFHSLQFLPGDSPKVFMISEALTGRNHGDSKIYLLNTDTKIAETIASGPSIKSFRYKPGDNGYSDSQVYFVTATGKLEIRAAIEKFDIATNRSYLLTKFAPQWKVAAPVVHPLQKQIAAVVSHFSIQDTKWVFDTMVMDESESGVVDDVEMFSKVFSSNHPYALIGWSSDGEYLIFHMKNKLMKLVLQTQKMTPIYENVGGNVFSFEFRPIERNMFFYGPSDSEVGLWKLSFDKDYSSYEKTKQSSQNYGNFQVTVSDDEQCIAYEKAYSSHPDNMDDPDYSWSEIYMDCLSSCSFVPKDGIVFQKGIVDSTFPRMIEE